MNIFISLLLTVLTFPTLIDRSDLGGNCESILSHRSISQQSINNGFVQGVVYANEPSAVGIVDNAAAKYDACNEFGERFYRPAWLASATLSTTFGLTVLENGRVVFQQSHTYDAETGVVKIQHRGASLLYYLNGKLVFISTHKDLASRDLRAYYFGTTGNPLIGIPRLTKLPSVFNWFSNGRSKRV